MVRTQQAGVIHWVDAHSEKWPKTNTLTGSGCFPQTARAGQFRNEDDANASQRTTGLTVEETVLLARRSDLAALRHRAASFLAYVEN